MLATRRRPGKFIGPYLKKLRGKAFRQAQSRAESATVFGIMVVLAVGLASRWGAGPAMETLE